MTELEPDEERYLLSHAAVDGFMARYGWNLLDRDEFVRRVIENMATGEFSAAGQAAMNIYCHCLYSACFGHEGPERQEIAFRELYRYLHALSFRKVANLPIDVRDELVHEAVERIWMRLGSYRKPGAFIAVAAMELHNVLKPCWQRPVLEETIDDVAEQLAASAESDPLANLVDKDRRQQVRACFEEVFRHHPEAKKRLDAVWLQYLGYKDNAISELLGTTTSNVQVWRSRGLDFLRKQDSWQRLAKDFDIGGMS